MNVSVAHRSNCRACNSSALNSFLKLPALPLTDAFLRSPDEEEFLAPIEVYLCADCGLSQTQHDLSVGEYYRDYQYTSASSGFFQTFMGELASEVWTRWNFKPGDRVLEVGSGDGAQLLRFKELGARVLGFEPSDPLVRASEALGVPAINDLFVKGSETAIPADSLPVNVVLLTYTFDHLPNPLEFLESVKPILDADRSLLVIEVHDFAKIFERREFCLLEHEHSIYPTAATLQGMLALKGFRVLEVGLLPEERRRANSLIVVATPEGSEFAKDSLPAIARGEMSDLEACRTFGKRVLTTLNSLSAYYVRRKAEGARLAGYGAGGRGVMTLAATAKPGDFAYVCDTNPSFHGYFTPGAHVEVAPPSRIAADPVDEVIVFSFGYIDEIREGLRAFTDRGGKVTSLLDLLKAS